jgi:hypothetical protein
MVVHPCDFICRSGTHNVAGENPIASVRAVVNMTGYAPSTLFYAL